MLPLTDEKAEAELAAAQAGPLAQELSLENESQKKERLKKLNPPEETKNEVTEPPLEEEKKEKRSRKSKSSRDEASEERRA